MAARLTDKRRKKIVADYLELGSYRATGRKNNVSAGTVKRIVEECDDIEQKVSQKKMKTPLMCWLTWRVSGGSCVKSSERD